MFGEIFVGYLDRRYIRALFRVPEIVGSIQLVVIKWQVADDQVDDPPGYKLCKVEFCAAYASEN